MTSPRAPRCSTASIAGPTSLPPPIPPRSARRGLPPLEQIPTLGDRSITTREGSGVVSPHVRKVASTLQLTSATRHLHRDRTTSLTRQLPPMKPAPTGPLPLLPVQRRGSQRERNVTMLATTTPASTLPDHSPLTTPVKRTRSSSTATRPTRPLPSTPSTILPIPHSPSSTLLSRHFKASFAPPKGCYSLHSYPTPPTALKPTRQADERPLVWRSQDSVLAHGFGREVPYIQGYNKVTLEAQRDTTHMLFALSDGSASFHDFEGKHPRDVLDLGCGDGAWIRIASGIWKVCAMNITFVCLTITSVCCF